MLPTDPEWWAKEGNVTRTSLWAVSIHSSVVRAGFAVLDLHYNLRREAFSASLLKGLEESVSNVQVHMLRMFAIKQLLAASDASQVGDKLYAGIKEHMLQHFPRSINLYGPTIAFDMIQFERAQIKYAKQPYRKTSGRHSGVNDAMMRQVCKSSHNL